MSKRFIVCDRGGAPMFDLDGRIQSATRTEKLNGEHKLDIVTSQQLEEGMRILVRDSTLKWREWVVDEPDESHSDAYGVGTYGCTWSVQYDLSTVSGGEIWDGAYDPISAGTMLATVLSMQSVWQRGTVDITGARTGITLFDGSVWDYLAQLVETWGGEIEPEISVTTAGVVTRTLNWYAHYGSETPKRRFDFGEDCTSIRRKPSPGPRYCRIVPRGGSDGEDEDGIRYSNRVGVEEEPTASGDGWAHEENTPWVRDPDAELLFRVPDGNGGWRYPEKIVIYDSTDPEKLLQLAIADLHSHTRPTVTYEADVLQFAEAGMDPHGVELGDEVHVVDRAFGDSPLRIAARIVELEVNELDETDAHVVIGEARKGIESALIASRSVANDADSRSKRIEGGGSSAITYVNQLISDLNTEANIGGGHWYIVPGVGARCYNAAVADPSIGAEATQVVEIGGGNIRFANSKTAQGAWEWRTFIESGHIAAPFIAAVNIIAGTMQSANGSFYVNLDSDDVRIGGESVIGDRTASDISNNLDSLSNDIEDAGGRIDGIETDMGIMHADLVAEIDEARRYATDYLSYDDGELTLGVSGTEIKNVMSATQHVFRTSAGDMAGFGLFDGIWEMFIETARVQNMLKFDDFAWIARANGNMSLKWMGE